MTVHDMQFLNTHFRALQCVEPLPSQHQENATRISVQCSADNPLHLTLSEKTDYIFVCSGPTQVSIIDDPLNVGECLFIPAKSVATTDVYASGDFVLLEVDSQFRKRLNVNGELGLDTIVQGRSACFSSLAETVRRHSRQRESLQQEYANAIAVLGFTELRSLPAPGPASEPELPKWQQKAVDAFIQSKLEYTIKVSEMAEICHYSTAHFSRLFKARTGRSPHRYILEKRVDSACELIRSGRKTLCDIAYATGFSSQSHMTSTFKQVLGLTPKDIFRAENKHMHETKCA